MKIIETILRIKATEPPSRMEFNHRIENIKLDENKENSVNEQNRALETVDPLLIQNYI